MKTFFRLLLTTLSSFFFFSFTDQAYALAKFSTTYQVNYTVYQSGVTHVKYFINQINNLSAVYATEFSLNVNHTRLENVRVADEYASLIPSVIKTSNGSIISFTFLNKVVGKDKKHFFTIEYDTPDVTNKIGNTWEINIPKLEPDENTTDHNIILTLTANFPQPAFIDPKPSATVDNRYYFSGKTLGNKSISAVFGQEQYYRVSLNYFLQNDTNQRRTQQIALPPDTSYQKVLIKKIEPQPVRFDLDMDGNWLASYTLNPKESFTIKVVQVIKVSFLPSTKSLSNPSAYLSGNEYWDFNDPVFTMPEISSLKTPRSIYDYVVDKLTYDFNKINRLKSQKLPASASLKAPDSAICTDFANVFIAIARKFGIPARELQGFALSNNPDLKPLSLKQDVLHAWPEYFDEQRNIWVQIDPTWAKTTQGIDYFNKLDFNHIVFVIHGQNPTQPLTAGSYKNTTSPGKDVSVDPITEIEFPQSKPTIGKLTQKDGLINMEVLNDYPVGFFGSVQISGQNTSFANTDTQIAIAPFSSTVLQISVNNRPLIKKVTAATIISINGQKYEQQIQIEPIFSPLALFTGTAGLLALSTFYSRHLYLRRRKAKASL